MKIGHIAMRRKRKGTAFGARALWVAAAVLAATWNLGILVALSLNEEPDRTARARTVDEASSAKQPANAGFAELQKSLQQERDRASKLEQDLAAARRDVETQTALAAKAGAEATQLKKTAEPGSTELQKSLQQERDRASKLEQDLAAARRDVETQTALAAKAGAEATQLKKTADAGSAELRKSLRQERDRASKLEQDLATARRDVETQTALAAKAGAEATQLKKTADAGTADLRKSLQLERDRASELKQDLAAARRDVKTQTALAVRSGEEAAQLKQVAERGSAEQRQSLQQEHDKAEALAQELSTARSKIYAYEAQARQASDQAAELKQAMERGTADLQKSLVLERDRAEALARELSATRRNIETQTALATEEIAEASRLKQVADSDSAERSQSLQRERDEVTQLGHDLALARSEENVVAPSVAITDRINTQSEAATTKPIATEQAAIADAPADPQSTPKHAAEVARLLARANLLLERGDVGSARIVLQRAAEMGDAQASFTLAETYDPLILSPKWGTYGTLGDAKRALDLYARAFAGGINEAKERSDALRR